MVWPKELEGGVLEVKDLEERVEGEKKGSGRGKKGLRGKIFRENSGNPQTARSDKDLLHPKLETATRSGAITYPLPPPCLRPYVWVSGVPV